MAQNGLRVLLAQLFKTWITEIKGSILINGNNYLENDQDVSLDPKKAEK